MGPLGGRFDRLGVIFGVFLMILHQNHIWGKKVVFICVHFQIILQTGGFFLPFSLILHENNIWCRALR
jgi:hypothetical protein